MHQFCYLQHIYEIQLLQNTDKQALTTQHVMVLLIALWCITQRF